MTLPGLRSSLGTAPSTLEERQAAALQDGVQAVLRAEAESYALLTDRLTRHITATAGMAELLHGGPSAAHCDVLAALAIALDTKDTKACNLLVGMQELLANSDQQQQRLAALRQTLQQLSADEAAAEADRRELQQLHEDVQARAEQRQVQAVEMEGVEHTLRTKLQEYHSTVVGDADRLRAAGFTVDLSHGALLRMAEQLRDTEARVEAKEGLLQTYLGLPVDPVLAEVRLEEAKQELAALQAQFKHLVTGMEL